MRSDVPRTDARVYLTGGATAVLEGWGATTVDVHHFDPYSQALSKLERAFDQDLEDVGEMLARGLIEGDRVRELFAAIEPELYRFPAVDPGSFGERVERFLRES